VVLVTIFGLSACAQIQREEAAAPEAGFQEWALVIEGEPIRELLQDPERARDILNQALADDEDPDKRYTDEELADLLARLEQDDTRADELPEALTGISGLSTAHLLKWVLAAPGQEEKISGLIRHYYFNDGTRGGYLEVDTKVETLQNGTVVQTDTLFWAVAVRPGTYQVHKRKEDPAHYPDDPFPGTVEFPQPAIDPNNPDGIWKRELDHKLFAKGTGIVVLGVIKNGVLLDQTNYRYTSTAASCIDLMFKGYPPESELPPQPAYCLGRCDHPQIVNTE
jgi:hypothetical protein